MRGLTKWPRIEVTSMWFKNKDKNNSCPFKGRIFIADQYNVHEIYNSATLDDRYFDIDDKNSSKRRKMASFSEITDFQLDEALQVVSDNTDLQLKGKKVQEASFGISLPVMGPTLSGMYTTEFFHVLVHQDSGNPDIENSYVEDAKYSFFGDGWSLPDGEISEPFKIDYHSYDQPYYPRVDCGFGLLTLECIVFPLSKSVHLKVEWEKPNKYAATDDDDDIYICGSLTVTPNIKNDRDITSVLLKTPPNKAVKAPGNGDFIPLLKPVVVVPLDSSFTVNAQLQYSNNANSAFSPIVENGAATFPVVDDDKDSSPAPEFSDGMKVITIPFYKSTKCIPCIGGGVLKVTAHVSMIIK